MSNRDIMENSMGYNGIEFISDTVQHNSTGNIVYVCLHILTDTVISQFTSRSPITGNTLIGVTIPSGTIIYGRFSSLTLTSGQVLAYKGV